MYRAVCMSKATKQNKLTNNSLGLTKSKKRQCHFTLSTMTFCLLLCRACQSTSCWLPKRTLMAATVCLCSSSVLWSKAGSST
uniref:Uncharacterized protein n=1 Tax=Rhipicephalus appendiculatus TaxID=34631 RepID=A0A131YCZ2_RHIAP